MQTKQLFTILIALCLSACATSKLIQPGTIQIGELEVTSPGQWVQFKRQDVIFWTRDGSLLNMIAVTTVNPGDHVLKGNLNSNNQGFKYVATASLDDTVELVVDALSQTGNHNVELIEREDLGSTNNESTRIDVRYDNDENLTYIARMLLIRDDNRLHVIYCRAPQEHYFPTYAPEFDQLIASAKVVSG